MSKIRIKHVKNPCTKYFPERKVGNTYSISDFVPKGMCPTAYAMCYPYALSLLHHGRFRWMEKTEPNAVYAACTTGRVVYRIRREESKKPDQKFEWKNEIFMDVTEVKDEGCTGCRFLSMCERKQSVGDSWEFPRGYGKNHLCPAAFNNLFPAILSLQNDSNTKTDEIITVECPDNNDRIAFEVSKVKE